jgi:putative SOS response-associated peptidase YedK
MCGRFKIIADPITQLIMKIVNGELGDLALEDRYNIAPTDDVPVLLRTKGGEWRLQNMRWWLVPAWSPAPSSKYTMFNAKSETLAKSRAFSTPFARQRCIIPASGYYEWRKEAATKVPYLIEPDLERGFAFAGLWDHWERNGQRIDSCTIITGAAPDSMRGLHHRVPIHLTKNEVDRWLNLDTEATELTTILSPRLRGPVRVTPVSSYVGNSRHKDPRCAEPIGDSKIIH